MKPEKLLSGIYVYRLKQKEIGSSKKYGTKFFNYQCPLCKKWFHSIVAVRNHIRSTGNKESIERVQNKKTTTKHLDFYIKNTKLVTKRDWIIPIC